MVAGSENNVVYVISGQGLAGTCVAWRLRELGLSFRISDHGKGGSSQVAAGLINPITGKNFEPSWKISDFYPVAIRFYQNLEDKLGEQIWHPMPIRRIGGSDREWDKMVSKLQNPEVMPWLSSDNLGICCDQAREVQLVGGGWLDTRKFLTLSREYFSKTSTQENPNVREVMIRCEGAESLIKDKLGAHRCAKGEIITLRAEWPESHIQIGAGGWLIPIGNGLFRAGSTYEWKLLDQVPTSLGMSRIIHIIEQLGGSDYEIIDHVAGIRPITRRSQPWVGKDRAGDWVFNGLGSKGTLYAPLMADMLVRWIVQDLPPAAEFIYPYLETV